MENVKVAALYKFVAVEDTHGLQASLLKFCKEAGIHGTLLIAHEGLNGTVAGKPGKIDDLVNLLRNDKRFEDIDVKYSYTDKMPFLRMKVRLKKEIVTLGVPGVDPTKEVGEYVEPKDWNALIEDPEVVLIDTRNDYEVEIGTFKGALEPNTKSFREFPEYVEKHLDPKQHKKVAMMCTGGIRCEKSTSYLKHLGFENVYHLKGGILRYLEEVKEEDSLWEGECFVFDQRVAVNHQLESGEYDQCHACRRPVTEEDKESEQYIKGESCHWCYEERSDEQKQRARERQKQMDIAAKRGTQHLGAVEEESPRG